MPTPAANFFFGGWILFLGWVNKKKKRPGKAKSDTASEVACLRDPSRVQAQAPLQEPPPTEPRTAPGPGRVAGSRVTEKAHRTNEQGQGEDAYMEDELKWLKEHRNYNKTKMKSEETL